MLSKEMQVSILHDKIGITKKQAKEAIDVLVNSIIMALENNDIVLINGLGRFSVKQRAARTGVNPRTGKKIKIPKQNAVKFKMSKKLKERLN